MDSRHGCETGIVYLRPLKCTLKNGMMISFMLYFTTTKAVTCQAPVACACNPSYSGDRGEEDCGSKPAKQIVSKTLS
jgi:hypothetical protein